MPVSQNGYQVIERYGAPYLTGNIPVPGTDVPILGGIAVGNVATVLYYVAARFHREVEPLRKGACWGYNYRAIRGQSAGFSNHAAGTAIDLNADLHGLGQRGTFTPAQVDAIHRIVAYCRGVVRWGGDYTGRVDPMHFEINAGPAAVADLAAGLQLPDSHTPEPVKQEEEDTVALVVNGNRQDVFYIKDGTKAIWQSTSFDDGNHWTTPGPGGPPGEWVRGLSASFGGGVYRVVGVGTDGALYTSAYLPGGWSFPAKIADKVA